MNQKRKMPTQHYEVSISISVFQAERLMDQSSAEPLLTITMNEAGGNVKCCVNTACASEVQQELTLTGAGQNHTERFTPGGSSLSLVGPFPPVGTDLEGGRN